MVPFKRGIFGLLSVKHAIDFSEEYAEAVGFSIGQSHSFIFHGISGVVRGWASGPNPTFWRGLFEWRGGFAPWSEFLSHLIRTGGESTRRDAHGRKWFWALSPKQKACPEFVEGYLVARGRNPEINEKKKTLAFRSWAFLGRKGYLCLKLTSG